MGFVGVVYFYQLSHGVLSLKKRTGADSFGFIVGVEYTTGEKASLLDEGIGRYLGISRRCGTIPKYDGHPGLERRILTPWSAQGGIAIESELSRVVSTQLALIWRPILTVD